jgi:hypothetical protein
MKIATPLITIASLSSIVTALTHMVDTQDGQVVNNRITARVDENSTDSTNGTNSTNELTERSNMMRSFHPCLGSFTYVLPQCCTYGKDMTVPLHCSDRESGFG